MQKIEKYLASTFSQEWVHCKIQNSLSLKSNSQVRHLWHVYVNVIVQDETSCLACLSCVQNVMDKHTGDSYSICEGLKVWRTDYNLKARRCVKIEWVTERYGCLQLATCLQMMSANLVMLDWTKKTRSRCQLRLRGRTTLVRWCLKEWQRWHLRFEQGRFYRQGVG